MSLKFKRNSYLEKIDKLMGTDYSSKTPTIAYLNMDGVARSWVFVALISTPYLLWLLLRLKKYGWIIFFSVFVLIPYIGSFVYIFETLPRILFMGISSMFWVVFLFLLKNSYKDWREPDFKNTPGSDFE